jgi:amino acid adenylation domain-containing protein
VRAIVSDDPAMRQWSRRKSIPCFDQREDLAKHFSEPVDHIFSIVNDKILRDDVLKLSRGVAINYHDAPLPRYAGVHATSWALINGERTHGVTWHVISDTVDAGDILKQRQVGVTENDTARTLNTKCLEAALDSFSELIAELANETVASRKQNLDERTIFLRNRRPANGGIIDWRRPATEIASLVRALDFGEFPNTLGTAKVSLGGRFFIVEKIEILGSAAASAPGTINVVASDGLQISSADREMKLRKIRRLDGSEIDADQLVRECGLNVGDQIEQLDDAKLASINELFATTARNEKFWVNRLSDLEPAPAPFARADLLSDSPTYSRLEVPVQSLIENLAAAFKSEDRSSLLFTVFVTLVARLHDADGFDIGYRGPDLMKATVGHEGLFACQIPLRIDLDGQESFREMLGLTGDAVERFRERQTYSLDVLARYPILRSRQGAEAFALPVGIAVASGTSTADIVPTNELTFVIAEDCTECFFIYDASCLTESAMRRLADLYLSFVREITDTPEIAVSRIPLLTPAEEKIILSDWNDTAVECPRDRRVDQLFESVAVRSPDNIAVVDGSDRITYGELNKRSAQLANRLVAMGVKPRDLVGICADRSSNAIVSILAILRAGAAYVPIDPAHPAKRIEAILADTRVSVVLTGDKYLHTMASVGVTAVNIDGDHADTEGEEVLDVDCGSEDPAYVIYTSGSTGLPKGVMVPHRALVNHASAMSKLYGLNPGQRVLQFTALSFDVAAEEIFPTLLSGATIVVADEKRRESIASFSELLHSEAVTVVNLPVSFWREWSLALEAGTTKIPSSLELVITGSERVLPEDYQLWKKIAGENIRWLNAYGLTETTITSIVFDPADEVSTRISTAVPIGRPIGNTRVYILNRMMQPVPPGIRGQIFIGGDGLASGYLNRPDITADRFIADPFAMGSGARLYKTGDVGRYTEEGQIEYLDRVDHQVKIRGFRVEMGEIESVLATHEKVQQAVVTAFEDGSGNAGLAAYVVPKNSDSNSGSQVEIWPSVGEYPVYDELMYYAMSTDIARTRAYRNAIAQLVKGKTVVEIGTGKDAILARFCVEAGAKKVYAIEALDSAFAGAQALIDSQNLSDKIELVKGLSVDVELPEKVDVCVSEIIGTIGSSEGVIPVLNDAQRFLKPDGCMIPARCVTKIVAVQLPDDVLESPRFSKLSGKYADKVFDSVGYPFDVRVCLKNFPKANILSDTKIAEDLDFSGALDPNYTTDINLEIVKAGRVDGFLLWLNLHTFSGLVIDTLATESSWLPVFLPAFATGASVEAGDSISAVFGSRPSDNGLNPDYYIQGELRKQNGNLLEFDHGSYHHRPTSERSVFSQKLFTSAHAEDEKPAGHEINLDDLRKHLADHLPGYMIPSVILPIDELPTAVSGKIDRNALPDPVDKAKSVRTEVRTSDDPLESKLVEIWKRVLGVSSIGLDDNFFELGGHSLKAIRMFAEIEDTFGKNIPLATLFEAGTVEKLAQLLRQEGWEAPESSLVPIQPNGARPPFFCIHAKGGNVLFYKDLARHLGPDQPLYGLQARRLAGRQVGHDSVEEMAAFYIKEIKTLQAKGPYYIGGASFGGLAAFEIAKQLQRQNDEIALVALLDTGTPDYPQALPTTTKLRSKTYTLVRRFQHHRDSLTLLNSSERIDYFLVRLKKVRLKYRRKVRDTYRRAVRELYKRAGGPSAVPKKYLQIEDLIWKAGLAYQPSPYSGDVTLFHATVQPLGIVPDRTLGWGRYVTGKLEIHDIPGHHGSIVSEPFVRVLAEKLRECIDKTLPEPAKPSVNFERQIESSRFETANA